MPKKNNNNEWKQINRSKKIWALLGEDIDVDSDDFIYLINALDSLGYEIVKKKGKSKSASELFWGIIKD